MDENWHDRTNELFISDGIDLELKEFDRHGGADLDKRELSRPSVELLDEIYKVHPAALYYNLLPRAYGERSYDSFFYTYRMPLFNRHLVTPN